MVEEEINLPKATLNQIVKKFSVPGINQTSKELFPFINVVAIEFIKTISGKANEICTREGKKTINTDHIFRAARELGMGELADELNKWYELYSPNLAKPVKLTPHTSDLTAEELRAEQALLLSRAKSEHGEETEQKIDQDETSYD